MAILTIIVRLTVTAAKAKVEAAKVETAKVRE
jgi:hypothetical protein